MSFSIILYTGEIVHVDEEDYHLVASRCWHTVNGYARTNILINGKYTSLGMHRMILGLKPGDGKLVDHIDGNRLNNRRSNLRFANNVTNGQNRSLNKKSTTGYKGVSQTRSTGRFRAKIHVEGKEIHLGYFDTAEKAAQAYNKAALELYGEFSRLNEV